MFACVPTLRFVTTHVAVPVEAPAVTVCVAQVPSVPAPSWNSIWPAGTARLGEVAVTVPVKVMDCPNTVPLLGLRERTTVVSAPSPSLAVPAGQMLFQDGAGTLGT